MKQLLTILFFTFITTAGYSSQSKVQQIHNDDSDTFIQSTVGATSIETQTLQEESSFDDELNFLSIKRKYIVLKSESNNVYLYSIEINPQPHLKPETLVLLTPINNLAKFPHCKQSNVKISDGTLSYKFNCNESKKEGEIITSGVFSKKLSLPGFCGFSFFAEHLFMNEGNEPTALHSSSTVNDCGESIGIPELKAIDLKNIPFCDYSKYTVATHCEVKDMSFLTSNL